MPGLSCSHHGLGYTSMNHPITLCVETIAFHITIECIMICEEPVKFKLKKTLFSICLESKNPFN